MLKHIGFIINFLHKCFNLTRDDGLRADNVAVRLRVRGTIDWY